MLTTSEMPRGDSYFLQGQQGGIVVNSPGNVSGPFRVILAIEDSEIFYVVGDFYWSNNLVVKVLKAGTSLQLKIDSFVLDSGTVIAYYA